MAVTRPCYTTRERVMRALDVKVTARETERVDAAINAASDLVDGGTDRIAGCLHRRFYPERRTMTFDWPDMNRSRPWRLWLNQHELIAVEQITAGGAPLAPDEFFLRPDDGPPYNRVEIDLSDDAAFSGADTHQRAIAIDGLYGYSDHRVPAGALAAPVSDTGTAITLTSAAAAGVGDLLLVGEERVLVTGRTMAATGAVLDGGVPGNTAASAVKVTGTPPDVGETILVGAERMLVVDAAGSVLIVKRAWDGTVLASHESGDPVFAPRTLTVARAAVGSQATAHPEGTPVERQVYPALVEQLATAEAINLLLQETAGYARTIGSGESTQEATGGGLNVIREQAYTAYGRKGRKRAV